MTSKGARSLWTSTATALSAVVVLAGCSVDSRTLTPGAGGMGGGGTGSSGTGGRGIDRDASDASPTDESTDAIALDAGPDASSDAKTWANDGELGEGDAKNGDALDASREIGDAAADQLGTDGPADALDASGETGCVAESRAALCSRLGKSCGSVTAKDNCGTSRTEACGPCGSPQTCSVDGLCVDRPSCAGLGMTCGPTGDASCCASSVVPGGPFKRSYDGVNYQDQSFAATVGDFRLDTYEITVGRFRKFAAAYPGTKPASGAGKNLNNPSDPGWDAAWNANMPADQAALTSAVQCNQQATWTGSAAGNELRPMNCLTWYEAFAFCIWDGGRLPTEAEWNYAAAGGSEQRLYPWSSPPMSGSINATYASYDDGTGCAGDGMPGCAVTDLLNVGTKPAGNAKWGHADIAGNVGEWVLDWYAPYVLPCINCAHTSITDNRVIRGGAFNGTAAGLTSSSRGSLLPINRIPNAGARCSGTP